MKTRHRAFSSIRSAAGFAVFSALLVAGCSSASGDAPSAAPAAERSAADQRVVDEMSATPEAAARIADAAPLGWKVDAWSAARVERKGDDLAAVLRMVRVNDDQKGEGTVDLVFTKGSDGKTVILSRATDKASSELLSADLEARSPRLHAAAAQSAVHTEDWWRSGNASYAYYTAYHTEFGWCMDDSNNQGWATLFVYEGGGAMQAWGPHYNSCNHVQTEPYPIYWQDVWWSCGWSSICS